MIAAIIFASKSDGQASRHTLWDMLVDSRFPSLPSSITIGNLDCLGVKINREDTIGVITSHSRDSHPLSNALSRHRRCECREQTRCKLLARADLLP